MTPFESNILALYGEKGRLWVETLPKLAQALAARWGLGAVKLAETLSYHAVYFSNAKPVVLKLGLDREALAREAQALTAYQGQGCVGLWDIDLENGALLIECASPGIPLTPLFPAHDARAVACAVKVMKRLYNACVLGASPFPRVQDWLLGLERGQGLPLSLLEPAKVLAVDLLKTAAAPVLLHGDLHHDNILSHHKDGWVAIDPKGVIGEPAYEAGAFIRNPAPALLKESQAFHLIEKRITRFASLLEVDPLRVRQWSYVQAVLAACWAVEDHTDPQFYLHMAAVLSPR